MVSSRFAQGARTQRQPPQCKKVPIPPPIGIGGCSTWPPTITWTLHWQFTLGTIPVDFIATIPTTNAGPWNYTGSVVQTIDIGGFPVDVFTYIDFHGAISTCAFLLQTFVDDSPSGPPTFSNSAGQAGIYSASPGPIFPDETLTTTPHPGTVVVGGA